jgi:hypothetical protein
MGAAPDGTTIITVPNADGTGPTVTVLHDPVTGTLAEPVAITVEHATAHIGIRHADGTTTRWSCLPGAHITAAALAENAGITSIDHIDAVTVSAVPS